VLALIVGVIVVAGGVLTVYVVTEQSNARAERCQQIVVERAGDRLLWNAILSSVERPSNATAIDGFRQIVDRFKPPLECDGNDIPVEVEP
jgi:hypothetical protein